MNKLFSRTLVVLLMAGMFTACSNNDDEEKTDPYIAYAIEFLHTWEYETFRVEGRSEITTNYSYTFCNDYGGYYQERVNTLTHAITDNPSFQFDNICYTWSVTDSMLFIDYFLDGYTETYRYRISGDTLYLCNKMDEEEKWVSYTIRKEEDTNTENE